VTLSLHAISSVSKSYVYLLHDFIRGFQYYKVEALFENLREEDALELEREYDNKYDRYAIAIYWNRHKLGFVAREKNNLFAKFIDAQILSFKAKIKTLEGEASSWEQLFYQIYIEKESDLQSNAKYLTLRREPRYRDYEN
jgi:hypothetical protein